MYSPLANEIYTVAGRAGQWKTVGHAMLRLLCQPYQHLVY